MPAEEEDQGEQDAGAARRSDHGVGRDGAGDGEADRVQRDAGVEDAARIDVDEERLEAR